MVASYIMLVQGFHYRSVDNQFHSLRMVITYITHHTNTFAYAIFCLNINIIGCTCIHGSTLITCLYRDR